MARIPLGVPRLDTILGGGAPPGSVVLLAGEAGAGAREFLYTAALVNGLAKTDPDRFDLLYGSLAETADLPEAIHVGSVTADQAILERELRGAFDPAMVEAGFEAITVTDFAATYFDGTRVPPAWARGPTARPDEASGHESGSDSLQAVAAYLEAKAPGNLVIIDAVTDLGTLPGGPFGWNEIAVVLKGLRRAAADWGGLVLVLLNKQCLPPVAFGRLVDAVDGTFLFEWATGGHELDRTMVLQAFRGVLPAIEDDELVRFETEVRGTGFQLSDVRKIR